MKKLFSFLLCFMFVSSVFADKYYVYIVKKGKVEPGQIAGHTEVGDVISVAPYTEQYKPTEKELAKYLIKVVDLTETERQELTEPIKHEFMQKSVKIIDKDKLDDFKNNELKAFKQGKITQKATYGDSIIVEYDYEQEAVTVNRKRKVDITKLSDTQEEEVVKKDIFDNITVKSLPSFVTEE